MRQSAGHYNFIETFPEMERDGGAFPTSRISHRRARGSFVGHVPPSHAGSADLRFRRACAPVPYGLRQMFCAGGTSNRNLTDKIKSPSKSDISLTSLRTPQRCISPQSANEPFDSST